MKRVSTLAVMVMLVACSDPPTTTSLPVTQTETNSAPQIPENTDPIEEPTEPVIEAAQIPYTAEEGYLVVNGKNVPPAVFNQKMKLIASFAKVVSPKDIDQYRQSSLDEIVRKTLLEQAAEKTEVSDKEIDQMIDKVKNGVADFDEHLQKLGQSKSEFRDEIAHSLRVKKLIADRVKISNEEVLAYYEKNKTRLAKDEQVRASHILLRIDPAANDTARKEVKTRARKIAALARKPKADFAKLAKEHSEGPTKTKGGDLGWFTRKRMMKDFADAAFALKTGEVSRPVRSQHGYHIIKTFEKKEATTPPFDAVKGEIEETLRGKRSKAELRTLVTELKKSAKVKTDKSKIVKNEAFKFEEPKHKVPSKVLVPTKNEKSEKTP